MHYGVEAAAIGLRFVAAFVLLAASVPKLLNPDDFREAVARYRLLPPRATTKFAYWLPKLELAFGSALFAGFLVPFASTGAAVLLATFSVAIAVNLLRGRTIDCGCEGLSTPRRITWSLVAVDGLMAAAALFVAFEAPRTLAIDALFRGRSGTLPQLDALSLLIAASLAVLGELIAREARRVRIASASFSM